MGKNEKGLKEKGWELVQIKAFTSWVNGLLEKRDMTVEDLKTDFSDGVRLINFLELLSGMSVKGRYDLNPPSRIHKIQNLNIGLTFVTEKMDVKNSGIGAEDFADGNLKLILGFLWTLFKKYKIQTIKHADKSSEEGLLLWVKNTTAGYNGVNIESFKHSFRSGLAFLALCDKYVQDPSILEYSQFTKDDPNANLLKAFEVAESKMGIPKLLDADEVALGEVDERSLVLYISLYFHAFVAKEQQRALEEDKARMDDKINALQGTLEQRAQRAVELDEENKNLKAQITELREKSTYQEEKIEVLNQLLGQENEEKQEQAKEIERLRKELEEKSKALEELQQIKFGLTQSVSDLESQVTKLNTQLSEETVSRKKENDEFSARDKVTIQGLGVLKKNLEEHIEDLHRWQRYLDFDISAEVDFTGELRPQIISEISKSTFDEQLAYLSSKLEKENAELVSLLKSKEAEQKAKKAQEKKKKERQKKNEVS